MKSKKKIFKGEPSGACPSYFKWNCLDAKGGGRFSYEIPGYHLSIHLRDVLDDPEEIDLDELHELVDKGDDRSIIKWFKFYLPRCMKLVPSRRYPSFLKGFWDAEEQGRVF